MIPMSLYDLVCAENTIFMFSNLNFRLLRFMTGLYSFMMREVELQKIETDAKNQFFSFVLFRSERPKIIITRKGNSFRLRIKTI